MTDRELLITLSYKSDVIEERVDNISKRIDAMVESNLTTALKMREIETKLRFYTAGISVIVAIATSVATSLIIQLVNQ